MRTSAFPAAAAAGLLALALGACATGRIPDEQKLEIHRAHAGEPVPSFQFFGSLNGWTPLGDSAVAVWTRPGEAYLLELTGRCQDLEFAQAISLTSTQSRVHARFDKVMVLGTGSIQVPCHIATIRPLDVKAVREAERQVRDGEAPAAQPAEGGSGT
ncbi:DUF6491 family protein [Luteimonas sp. Y-2-2-4F]|nr:DUF6491 family protein [Luteimonas sp. Y-2-2-4F]MCD9031630.1 DUF6491 family protein [Luteimonas sp. Y-2-2-4F]MCD9031795.1 DUF6491 family protein [Luteimonas sp. Y-2-2-4F]